MNGGNWSFFVGGAHPLPRCLWENVTLDSRLARAEQARLDRTEKMERAPELFAPRFARLALRAPDSMLPMPLRQPRRGTQSVFKGGLPKCVTW